MALTACTDMPAPRPEAPGRDACGASGYRSLIGRPLAAVTLPADLDARTYAEGDPVTMDYRATRLNIVTDDDGTIIEVRCG
ncbi:lipoprotein [Roseivivax marinus]|uniref:Lipoprotein n=1 Tax=Roseivivax marinus TaxID=1379903 RepID=W4HEM0_9RHOB|nr:I78 family peptidase inhibitor [Roseivivax marinus]ETW11159.1 lipoprotein [Roseivivax marinus]